MDKLKEFSLKNIKTAYQNLISCFYLSNKLGIIFSNKIKYIIRYIIVIIQNMEKIVKLSASMFRKHFSI